MTTISKNDLEAAQGGWYGGWGPRGGGNPYWAIARELRAEQRAASYWNNQMWPIMAAAAFANQQPTTVVYTY